MHQDVHPAECARGIVDEPAAFLRPGHIARSAVELPSQRDYLFFQLAHLRAAARSHYGNTGASFGQS
jgi:hypothetical protein